MGAASSTRPVRRARARAATFTREPERFRFEDAAYLNHETWIAPALGRLGDVRGLEVLDFGCGHGMASVVLARRGARVTAFDLSPGYLDEARRRARANEVAVIDVASLDVVTRVPTGSQPTGLIVLAPAK